ncbi:hypothetical protein BKA67DRAFT_529525 [Truncatella angustata]|uniref:Uncharacterized protein n=1 Tax=Truncatella angustata TaxID=152316 RepID=A0A9P9A1C7_9PEZI|nr:uncharacterized protein BKA67DRAFT_529525 [Truncatella angustata]KAH6659371.1 hypothetical protein BKA67DRAFT_529525 [Truncatella angustata]
MSSPVRTNKELCMRAITHDNSGTVPRQQNILSHKEMAEGSDISVHAWRAGTAFKFWDCTVDIEQPLDRVHMNTYVGQLVTEYQGISTLRSLVRAYQEDFEGWTTYQFEYTSRPFKRAMLKTLERKGYHFPSGLTQNEKLVYLLDNKEAVRAP